VFVDGGMGVQEALGGVCGLEALHLAFAPAHRLVRVSPRGLLARRSLAGGQAAASPRRRLSSAAIAGPELQHPGARTVS